MHTKKSIWLGIIIGSSIGSYIPILWGAGAGLFSFSSIIFSALGAFAGLWIAFKIS